MSARPELEWHAADGDPPAGDEPLCPGCRRLPQPAVRDLLSPPEVGAILRRGRSWMYAQLRLYIESGGTEGVPCFRDGPNYFIPRQWLENYLGYAITQVPPHNRWDRTAPEQPASPPTRRRPNQRLRLTDQLDLPFEE